MTLKELFEALDNLPYDERYIWEAVQKANNELTPEERYHNG